MNESRMVRRLLHNYGRACLLQGTQGETPFVGVLQPSLSANRLYPEDVRILLLVEPEEPPLQEGNRFRLEDPIGAESGCYYILKIILHHLGRRPLYRQCIVVADWEEASNGTH